MLEQNRHYGVFYALLSTILWGSYPLWYRPLQNIDATDVLAFRVIGSAIFVLIFIRVIHQVSWHDVKQLLRHKKPLGIVTASALVTAIWWLTYIYAVKHSLVLEASLGYFISPIVSVFLGYLLFKERPDGTQWLAIFITFIAIANLMLTLQEVPWVTIIIGVCFSLYAAIRKGESIKPLPGLAAECLLLLPFALLFIGTQAATSESASYASISYIQWGLLIAVGLISVLPLWWYSIAAQNLALTSLSFFQLIPPTCNFLFALFLFNETFTNSHLVTFSLIWIASVVYLVSKLELLTQPPQTEGEKT